MESARYLEVLEPKMSEETKVKCLAAMDTYGENHWWLSNDVRLIGYWQLQEPLLLVDFGRFHKGVEKLLGRPVWTHEFGLNWDGLKNEAANAMLGVVRSEEEKAEAARDAMFSLLRHAAEHGKKLFMLTPENEL